MQTVQELRERAGMTQMQLAVRLGVTIGSVSSWERGLSEPRASQVRAMAKLFGVSMDDIAFEAEEAKSVA